jgi:hypothetical protein
LSVGAGAAWLACPTCAQIAIWRGAAGTRAPACLPAPAWRGRDPHHSLAFLGFGLSDPSPAASVSSTGTTPGRLLRPRVNNKLRLFSRPPRPRPFFFFWPLAAAARGQQRQIPRARRGSSATAHLSPGRLVSVCGGLVGSRWPLAAMHPRRRRRLSRAWHRAACPLHPPRGET